MFNNKTLAVIKPSIGDAYLGMAISEGNFVVLRNARLILNAGTTEGITQLHSGPMEHTRLGEVVPKLLFPFDQIAFAFPVEEGPWQS